MTVRIIDRRFDSKHKSAVNRQRFIRRFKGQIRKAVADAITRRGITDIDSGENIAIPGKDISEPQFQHGQGGVWEGVQPGNDRFHSGDEIERPAGGGSGKGRGGGASNEGEHLDDFVFTLSRDEFLDIFFDDLALPNLVKRQLAKLEEFKRVRAGFTHSGVPTNINIVRTMRDATGRRIAASAPYRAKIRELQARLDELLRDHRTEIDPEVVALRKEIARLKLRIEAIPFIDDFDLRYNNRIRIPQPSTQAVMFCLMDVSGSMDEQKKQTAKRFFMLLYLFLQRSYEKIELVFIRHHTTATEVNEDDFFHSRESGGTVVSSALDLMQKIMAERYSSSLWNIYAAQASDGDNWENDSPRCAELLAERILPGVQYFAYIEITPGEPQNLWKEYQGLEPRFPGRFAMQRIEGLEDIYPVFRELFRKKLA
ncbi:YeaH/YhbH family protein [Oryzomicrobium sp.]|uniref:YeaH/YhbH family protein n=1 Tax=Oryzomicrobium sp. TaxID=1911578 RepID=UPI0025FDD88E|nr:YeaH/YhbH family protein [Oryzomicrobium sp.]MCE1242209.1 YeaH/YhbH family protein [Oryzomicrobium sp.]